MLNQIMDKTNEYVNACPKKERKKYGQFFTPITTAKYMASLVEKKQKKVCILDPGAGNGLLTAALIERLVETNPRIEIKADLYENDEKIQPLLLSNVEIIKGYCKKSGVKLKIRILKENFIISNRDYWKRKGTKGFYDVVICNPPYLKVGKDTEESVAMQEIVYGQPNLYFLFMAMAVKMLHSNGEMVFITPRSWTSGLYFKCFRKWFLAQMDIRHTHLFHSRSRAFQNNIITNDNILQETMITYAVKNRKQSSSMMISSCNDANSFQKTVTMTVKSDNCLMGGSEKYFLLPLEEEDVDVLNFMKTMPNSVTRAGYRFKTGQVVEFRNKEFVSYKKTNNAVPLLHSCNIVNGKITFPTDTDKPQYFLEAEQSEKNIIDNRNTVFIKRATAKEEVRRLQPALHIADKFEYSKFAAENHVNYLIKIGDELSICEVYGFYTILTSNLWERYYRMLNGSTQVNSEELNSMPIPERQRLQHIGRLAIQYSQRLKEIPSDEVIRRALA